MILFIKSLVFVLFIVKSLSTSSDDGVKYANKCEGLYDIIYTRLSMVFDDKRRNINLNICF